MRRPGFWSDPPGRRRRRHALLGPLARLYAAATARRVARPPGYVARVPVISVGNLHAGGTGKTPLALALVERLTQAGHEPHVVTRGHGGRLQGPVRVDPARHGAREVGDEALILAPFGPVWVARDRGAGARAAEAGGAGAIVLDDAHQNPGVAKDVAIVCIPAPGGFGNARVLPAGPLREPVAAGLARADLVALIGPEDARRGTDLGPAADLPRIEGEVRPLATGMAWSGLRALAFAGIARPEAFFDTLRGEGAVLAGTVALDDHQPVGPALFRRLQGEAKAARAQLVTTEKDAARLSPEMRREVLVLPVRLEVVDWGPFDRLVAAPQLS